MESAKKLGSIQGIEEMSTGEESFVPNKDAEVESVMPAEELETPTKASSMKEGAESSTPEIK